MNQTSKSKAQGGKRRAAREVWVWGGELVHMGQPRPGPRHQFMMQLRFRVMK